MNRRFLKSFKEWCNEYIKILNETINNLSINSNNQNP